MLLTSRQVAQKLGIRPALVSKLARDGKIPTVKTDRTTPSGRTNYEFDPKQIRDFAQTYTPPAPKVRKSKANGANGHAEFPLPLSIPTLVELRATQNDIHERLKAMEVKLDRLMKAWGVE